MESSREILPFYYFDEPIPEDSQEIRDKIEQLNKLIQESRILRAQAANEPDLDKRKKLNTEAMREVPTMHELEKEIFLSRKQVLSSLPIRVAIEEAKIKGQKFLLKLRLAAKSNDWTSSMPLSEEEFNVFNDAVKKVAVKDMNEATSNSEIIPAILLIEETLSKYDAEIAALEAKQPIKQDTNQKIDLVNDYGLNDTVNIDEVANAYVSDNNKAIELIKSNEDYLKSKGFSVQDAIDEFNSYDDTGKLEMIKNILNKC